MVDGVSDPAGGGIPDGPRISGIPDAHSDENVMTLNLWCPKSVRDETVLGVTSGFHCGHEIHRDVKHIQRLTAKCCWCDELVEITFSIVKIAVANHGMGFAQKVEVWDLPMGWEKGDGRPSLTI